VVTESNGYGLCLLIDRASHPPSTHAVLCRVIGVLRHVGYRLSKRFEKQMLFDLRSRRAFNLLPEILGFLTGAGRIFDFAAYEA